MKLSKTQQRVIDDLMNIIDEARSYETAEDYFDATNHNNSSWNTAEKVKAKDIGKWEFEVMWWNRKRDGMYLIREKTETVRKLETLGLIEVIERPKCKGGYELVKLLNY